MSTRVELLYRDACNYKTGSTYVFTGDPTPELVERLRAACDSEEFIVPEQVGLTHPAREDGVFSSRFPDEEDDHGFVEVLFEEIAAVDDSPNAERSFEQFVKDCEAVEDWDADVAIEAAGGWTDPDEAARLRNGDD